MKKANINLFSGNVQYSLLKNSSVLRKAIVRNCVFAFPVRLKVESGWLGK